MKTYFLEQLLGNDEHMLSPCVLTIGNFDGVHLGHQAMLQQTITLAQEKQLASAVMVFEPQPREFFAPDSAPARLTNFAEKQALLKDSGIEYLIVAKFDTAFRSLSATDFADMLRERLSVQALVLGDDFRFGHDRTGDGEFLRQYGLSVQNLNTITDNADSRISSTRIRELLLAGQLSQANTLLGRDYTITGEVVGGDKIGRTLDFPTANITLDRLKPALHGVFAVDVQMLDDKGDVLDNGFAQHASPQPNHQANHQASHQVNPQQTSEQQSLHQQIGVAGLRPHSLFGTANIGTRPSVDKSQNWKLEVHFPNYQGDLYGQRLQVRFLHFLHGERHYDSLASLQAGITQDVKDLLAWRQAQ